MIKQSEKDAYIFIIIGLIYNLFPRLGWNIEVRWKSADKEPTKNNIILYRIIGIILCLLGIYQMLK